MKASTASYPYLTRLFGALMLFSLFHQPLVAQEFFTQYTIGTNLIKDIHYSASVRGYVKHLYQYPGWRRIGAELKGGYKKGIFQFHSGIDGRMTYEEEINNFIEIRPWMQGKVKIPITTTIHIHQSIREESRNFIYTQSDSDNLTKFRTRFKTSVSFELNSTENSNKVLVLTPGAEWYMNGKLFKDERFVNSQEYSLSLKQIFTNSNSLSLTYGYEVYKDSFDSSDNNGHCIYLTFWFD